MKQDMRYINHNELSDWMAKTISISKFVVMKMQNRFILGVGGFVCVCVGGCISIIFSLVIDTQQKGHCAVLFN